MIQRAGLTIYGKNRECTKYAARKIMDYSLTIILAEHGPETLTDHHNDL